MSNLPRLPITTTVNAAVWLPYSVRNSISSYVIEYHDIELNRWTEWDEVETLEQAKKEFESAMKEFDSGMELRICEVCRIPIQWGSSTGVKEEPALTKEEAAVLSRKRWSEAMGVDLEEGIQEQRMKKTKLVPPPTPPTPPTQAPVSSTPPQEQTWRDRPPLL